MRTIDVEEQREVAGGYTPQELDDFIEQVRRDALRLMSPSVDPSIL